MGLFSFFDRFRASADDRSPWGDFWFEPVTVRTSSGMRVSADNALRLAAVYAETMASLPFVLYRQRADGGKDKVTDHWLYRLLAKRPNRYQNPFEWREMLQGHLALRGNAYNQIVANSRGEITELVPIHPDRIKMELTPSGDYRYRVMDRLGNESIVPRGDIWHLRGLSSDGLMGMSPIELARESLGMALAAQDYGSRFFANDAKPTGGWIEFPGSFKDAEAKKVFRESYLMDGIYSNGKSIDESDSYYREYLRFMGVVNYGRPAGEHWPKLSLLEIMGIILTEKKELEFLTKTLPHYERTLAQSYKVELKHNDAVQVLRKAPGWRPPTLRFEFLDSALEMAKQQF